MSSIPAGRSDRRGRATAAAGARARSTALRWVAAVAVAVSAGVHVALWRDGMRDVDVVGPAFLANGVGGVVVAVALVTWRHWLPLLAAITFGAATLGAYVTSRTVGLFGVHEQVWTTEAVTSAVTEVVAIVVTAVAWRVEGRPRSAPTG